MEITSKNNKDKKIILAAVIENGSALKNADKSLQKDKKIVMAAIQNRGSALQYADKSLQKNKVIVLAAVARVICRKNSGVRRRARTSVYASLILPRGDLIFVNKKSR